MKKLFYVALAVFLSVTSCQDFDDSAIWNKINDHETRIADLEELCKQLNTNISSLQSIVNVLQSNDYVKSVAPITKDNKTIGYTITFTKSQPITIYNGEDGEDGQNGSAPAIGVKKDADGIYYWTLDGDWLLDAKGAKIKAQGEDGEKGIDGFDGITPRLKIEDKCWYVSYDAGASWEMLGPVVGDAFFNSVKHDEQNVYLTLSDGTELVLPRAMQSVVNLTLSDVSYNNAYFDGEAFKTALDLKVTVYYGLDRNLNKYNFKGTASVTEFTGKNFVLDVPRLKSGTKYYYFSEVVFNGDVTYSSIDSLTTKYREFVPYVDEYGVDHGNGLEMAGIVWAPVNCGYHKDNFKYGKLYQWGRKYGQGYSGQWYERNGAVKGEYSDATEPTITDGPVSFATGNESSNANVFYSSSSTNGRWFNGSSYYWNSGNELTPVKADNDPCPSGWRIPTNEEISRLWELSRMQGNFKEGEGIAFHDEESFDSNNPYVLFLAAGYRDKNGNAQFRGCVGRYWTSKSTYHSSFTLANVSTSSGGAAVAMSVRCIQE